MDRLGGYFGAQDADEPFDYEGDEDPVREAPPSPVGQDERRMQVRAYNHWASLLGDRTYPAIEDLEPELLDDFGPFSVLLDLTIGLEDAEIRFLGSELAAESRLGGITRLAEVPSRSVLSRITDHYLQILANQAPIGFEAEFQTERGANVLYRGILLPYSSDNETIDFIYGVINWKEMADKATADELLLEIDQALAGDVAAEAAAEAAAQAAGDAQDAPPATALAEPFELDAALALDAADMAGPAPVPAPSLAIAEDDGVLDLEPAAMIEAAPRADLPSPAFGTEPAAPRARAVDALGNPLGVPVAHDDAWEAGVYEDEIDRTIKTAADYGLPDWDDEEGEEAEDVEDLVDPLSGEDEDDGAGSLMSLVSRGMRQKKSVDLSSMELPAGLPDGFAENAFAAPDAAPDAVIGDAPASTDGEPDGDADGDTDGEDAYITVELDGPPEDDAGEAAAGADEAEAPRAAADAAPATPDQSLSDFAPAALLPEAAPSSLDVAPLELAPLGLAARPAAPLTLAARLAEADRDDGPAPGAAGDDVAAPEGLYDALASARELAQSALTTEDRSRKTLYAAVSQAYDFSLEAAHDPQGYGELIADYGLTMQDRAPMTPIVKLVFGADYDKTRLTEYAAVLTHAHRVGVERGSLATYLRRAEGGLKGVVQAERKLRREEQGKPVEDHAGGIRAALAKKLRVLEPVDLADIAAGEGEFALVMVRRLRNGALVVLGEVPEDVALIEKAARKLLG